VCRFPLTLAVDVGKIPIVLQVIDFRENSELVTEYNETSGK
jgi:hypothetical protein